MALNEFVVLYTTAARSKQPYRRGILDALCYPEKHVIRYRYKLKEIAPDLRDLAGQTRIPALVVFVDSQVAPVTFEVQSVTYYPLRLCKILKVPSSSDKSDESRLEFDLELGDYVLYDSSQAVGQWHRDIAVLDPLRGMRNAKPTYFAIVADRKFELDHKVDLAQRWESLVTLLARSNQMKDAVFIRLSRPELRDKSLKRRAMEYLDISVENESGFVEPSTEGLLTSYQVQPAKEYRIDITIFDSPFPSTGIGQNSGLQLQASSDQVYLAQPFHTVVSGLVERSAILSFKRTTERLLTTLAFTVTDIKPETTTNNPVMHLYITPRRRILVSFLLLVFFGTFLVSLDVDGIRLVIDDISKAHFVFAITKILGSFMVGAAAFLAYQALPSAGAKG
jgi:hypothetical protein